jgi:predicted GNAT family acetyltransferase
MDQAEITLEKRGTHGRYVMAMPDGELAELTYVERAPGHIIVDHTWVPPRHRGRGVALKLVVKAVADARAAGTRITPLCSYVAAEFRHHPEWSDVLKR